MENFTSLIKKYNKEFKYTLDPKNEGVKKYKFAENWKERKISTFEYLMWMNLTGGRSYNDLSQYHVFPWIFDESVMKHNTRDSSHQDKESI